MTTTPIEWKRPPVIEVVLGVQFAPLKHFNNGHLGWFWREMKGEYPNATDAAPIQTVVESFGDEPEFGFPGIGIAAARGDSRLRMTSAGDGSRMIQVQNGWLVVNWMKREGQPYPGYAGVLQEFERAFDAFRMFVATEGLGTVTPNLWEVTYIDHVKRGTVWHEYSDVPRALPGLLGNCASPRRQFESLSARWSFRLQPSPARLNVSLQTARSAADPAVELLVMTSTARGPINAAGSKSLAESLNFGQAGVVDTFMAVTSEEARAYWKG